MAASLLNCDPHWKLPSPLNSISIRTKQIKTLNSQSNQIKPNTHTNAQFYYYHFFRKETHFFKDQPQIKLRSPCYSKDLPKNYQKTTLNTKVSTPNFNLYMKIPPPNCTNRREKTRNERRK